MKAQRAFSTLSSKTLGDSQTETTYRTPVGLLKMQILLLGEAWDSTFHRSTWGVLGREEPQGQLQDGEDLLDPTGLFGSRHQPSVGSSRRDLGICGLSIA